MCPLRTLLRAMLAGVALTAAVAPAPDAFADGVLPGSATPMQREQAQSLFARAKALLAAKQIPRALAEFRASHEVVSSPNTRLEIARCLRAMGREVAAYAELGRTAIEAKELAVQDDRYRRAYRTALAERAEIEPKLGFVTLTIRNATQGTRVMVGGEEVRRAAWTEAAPVLAGARIQVLVSTPGRTAVLRAVTLNAGEKLSLTIDAQGPGQATGSTLDPGHRSATAAADGAGLSPEKPAGAAASRPSTLRPWAYGAGIAGAAGLATFVIFGAMARSSYDDLNGACHGGPCPPSREGEISSGRTHQTMADIGLGAGLVGVAAAATLFVLTAPGGAHPKTETASVAIGAGWTGVRGTW